MTACGSARISAAASGGRNASVQAVPDAMAVTQPDRAVPARDHLQHVHLGDRIDLARRPATRHQHAEDAGLGERADQRRLAADRRARSGRRSRGWSAPVPGPPRPADARLLLIRSVPTGLLIGRSAPPKRSCQRGITSGFSTCPAARPPSPGDRPNAISTPAGPNSRLCPTLCGVRITR